MQSLSQREFKSNFAWSLSDRQRRILFFREHAGYCVGRRILGAMELADAEIAAEQARIRFEWHWDDDADWSWMDQECFAKAKLREQEHEVFYCLALDDDGECLASLGSIFDPSNEYRRVIEAELAQEALGELCATPVGLLSPDLATAAGFIC